jgi:hypothetical protein
MTRRCKSSLHILSGPYDPQPLRDLDFYDQQGTIREDMSAYTRMDFAPLARPVSIAKRASLYERYACLSNGMFSTFNVNRHSLNGIDGKVHTVRLADCYANACVIVCSTVESLCRKSVEELCTGRAPSRERRMIVGSHSLEAGLSICERRKRCSRSVVDKVSICRLHAP